MNIGLILAALIMSLPSVSDAADTTRPSEPNQAQSQNPKTGQPTARKASLPAKANVGPAQKPKPSQIKKARAAQNTKTAQRPKQKKVQSSKAKGSTLQRSKSSRVQKQKTTRTQKPAGSQGQKPQTSQPRAQIAQPPASAAHPEKKARLIAFSCYASTGPIVPLPQPLPQGEGSGPLSKKEGSGLIPQREGRGASDPSKSRSDPSKSGFDSLKSRSINVEGRIGSDSAEISLFIQEREGGKILSRYNWTGSIRGRAHTSLMQLASNTRFEEKMQGEGKEVTQGYSAIEVTLQYRDEREKKEVKGTPVNLKAWQEFLDIMMETALSKRSERLTGLRCFMPVNAGAGGLGSQIATEMECSIGSSNTILVFGIKERSGGKLQPVLQWAGEIDGDLHRRLVQVAEATRLDEIEEGAPEGRGVANRFEVTLRYPDGERTGKPSNPDAWKEILGTIEEMARAGKK